MKLTPLILATVVGSLALAGCSSSPKRVDSGAIHASTFSFVQPGGRQVPANTDTRAAVQEMIHHSITQNLAGRGVARVQGVGDVVVAYLVIVGNNVSTVAIDDYFGYGRSAGDLQEKAHKAYTSSKNPNYYEAGTLVVDFIDAKSSKLLWRNHVTRPVLRDATETTRRQRIQEAVDQVLKDLRIAK